MISSETGIGKDEKKTLKCALQGALKGTAYLYAICKTHAYV